ncbi:MAG: PTS transporter subunit EIIB, partial [Synergistaceae bacterium]|nr:PTS transporter subunit EIIB [Synergistaceae bacterium]
MGKFAEQAKELLEAVGGRENVAAVSHCITRMRYVLVDPKKADIKRIEAISAVKGTFTQAGQFQVIIGNEVADFYKDFSEVSGISGVSKAEVKAMSKQNQNILQKLMTSIAEIFAPLIPAIVVGGLILGFRNVIDSMEIFG